MWGVKHLEGRGTQVMVSYSGCQLEETHPHRPDTLGPRQIRALGWRRLSGLHHLQSNLRNRRKEGEWVCFQCFTPRCLTIEVYKAFYVFISNKLPMRAVEDGGVEGRATVAAYDWLAGGGATSSCFSCSFWSSCSSLESNSLWGVGRDSTRQDQTHSDDTGKDQC